MKIIFALIVSIVILILILFFGIRLKDDIHLQQFENCKKGMDIHQTRNILGKPDETKFFGGEIMDVYYYFPMAETRIFFSKKDSILVRSWHTDAD